VKWKEKCESLLGEVGGIGSGYVLHTWEDPFKKPEPPATTPAAEGSTPPAAPVGTPPTSAPATPPTTQSDETKSTPKAATKKSSDSKSKAKGK
jgi:hypothetical protein